MGAHGGRAAAPRVPGNLMPHEKTIAELEALRSYLAIPLDKWQARLREKFGVSYAAALSDHQANGLANTLRAARDKLVERDRARSEVLTTRTAAHLAAESEAAGRASGPPEGGFAAWRAERKHS